jgi:hypothetical protein
VKTFSHGPFGSGRTVAAMVTHGSKPDAIAATGERPEQPDDRAKKL